jgi:DNA-binding winged helix-turn-helix (wHTH) protein
VSVIRFVNGAEFDIATGELRRDALVIRLEPQPAAVLITLATRAGELVSHEELRRAVWGDSTHVKVPDALHYCVRQIRAALEDTAREPRHIENIPRRGYRLRADSIVPVSPSSRRATAIPRRWALCLAIAALLATTIFAFDRRPNNHHEIAVRVVKTLHNLVF